MKDFKEIRMPHGAKNIDLSIHDPCANLLIIIEPSASVSLRYGSMVTEQQKIERSIRCIVGENAQLTIIYDETWDDSMCIETEMIIEQKRASVVHYRHRARGAFKSKHSISLSATEPDTHADIKGIYDISGEGAIELTTLQYHDAAHTKSTVLFKNVMRDNAQITHRGTIAITPKGTHTESSQHMHTLLLSNGARAIAVPNIEVETHRVQCGHGSAIGRLDEEHVWMLQSRGLSRAQAEQCLINGFLDQLV